MTASTITGQKVRRQLRIFRPPCAFFDTNIIYLPCTIVQQKNNTVDENYIV